MQASGVAQPGPKSQQESLRSAWRCAHRHRQQILHGQSPVDQRAHRIGQKTTRPFSIQKDGDLWEMFYAGLKMKGAKALKITKVKGHTSEATVEQGRVTREDKDGNDHADTIVDEGVQLHGKETVETGSALTRRHIGYAKSSKTSTTTSLKPI